MLRKFIEENFELQDLDGKRVFMFDNVAADLDFFLTHFGGAESVTARELKAQDPSDTMGWHRHFDTWAGTGILPQ